MNIMKMDATRAADYRCPATGSKLKLDGDTLISKEGHVFAIEDGVPNLNWPPQLGESEERTKQSYDRVAEQIYDAALEWQFAALYEDEERVRESMLDQLDIAPGQIVLEVGCGDGTGQLSHRSPAERRWGTVHAGPVAGHGAYMR